MHKEYNLIKNKNVSLPFALCILTWHSSGFIIIIL